MRTALVLLTAVSLGVAGGIAAPAGAQTAGGTIAAPGAAPGAAQPLAWVQIEAQPTLQQAQEAAARYAHQFPNVAGFQLPSGWYAIALGPYAADQAPGTLQRLLAAGAVPHDSYVSDAHAYGARFWPTVDAPAAQAGSAVGTTVGTGADTGATTGATTAVAPAETTAAAAPVAPVAPAVAAAAPAAPTAAALPAPDTETPAEARQSEALMSADDRMELQRALAWSGQYSGGIDGAFGPGTRNAMAAWQQAQGLEPTGVLTTAQRRTLIDGYHADQAALGLKTVQDDNAGISIDLPGALLDGPVYQPPFAHYAARGDSGVQVVLISQPGGSASLPGLYDRLQQMTIVPAAGPRSLTDRGFDIEGTNDTVHTVIHAEVAGDAVKGWLLSWTPGKEARMARVLAAMRGSFRVTGPQALDATMVPLSPAQKAGMVAGLEPRKPVIARSGFYVDRDGDVLTTTEVLQGCGRVSFGANHTAKVAYRDDALGIALLKPEEPIAPRAVARIATALPVAKAPVAVAGFSYGGVLPQAVLTLGAFDAGTGLNGEADLRRLTLSALPGDVGGPVLDASGALVGMLLPKPAAPGKVLPASVAYAAGAQPIAAAVAGQGATLAAADPAPALAPVDLAALGARMTVLVSCWK